MEFYPPSVGVYFYIECPDLLSSWLSVSLVICCLNFFQFLFEDWELIKAYFLELFVCKVEQSYTKVKHLEKCKKTQNEIVEAQS
jgi:hypothetical protein